VTDTRVPVATAEAGRAWIGNTASAAPRLAGTASRSAWSVRPPGEGSVWVPARPGRDRPREGLEPRARGKVLPRAWSWWGYSWPRPGCVMVRRAPANPKTLTSYLKEWIALGKELGELEDEKGKLLAQEVEASSGVINP